MKNLLGAFLPAMIGFGPFFMVLVIPFHISSAGMPLALSLMPYIGAIMVSAGLLGLYLTTLRQTYEIDLLRKQLEVLKAAKSWEQFVVDFAQLATQEAQDAERLATQRRRTAVPIIVLVLLLTGVFVVFVILW